MAESYLKAHPNGYFDGFIEAFLAEEEKTVAASDVPFSSSVGEVPPGSTPGVDKF